MSTSSSPSRSVRSWSTSALCLILGGIIATIAALHPTWNFDALGYAAASQRWLGADDVTMHQRVYSDAARAAPPAAHQQLTSGSNYRRKLTSDPQSFSSQVPMYSNKPAYLGLITAAVASGANSVKAPFVVSALALGVLIAYLGFACTSLIGRWGWALAGCIALIPPVLELGRIATPDALCAMLAVPACWQIYTGKRLRVASALMVLATFARPDYSIVALVVGAWWFARRPQQRGLAVVSILLVIAGTVFSGWVAGSTSWAVLFNHGFIRSMTTLEQMQTATVTVGQYWQALRSGFSGSFVLHPTIAAGFAALTVVSLYVSNWSWNEPRDGRHNDNLSLQALLWATFAARILIFPMLADRFFIAHFLLIGLLTLAILRAELGERVNATTPPRS